jgi:hypothetical protein
MATNAIVSRKRNSTTAAYGFGPDRASAMAYAEATLKCAMRSCDFLEAEQVGDETKEPLNV